MLFRSVMDGEEACENYIKWVKWTGEPFYVHEKTCGHPRFISVTVHGCILHLSVIC